MTVDEVLEDVLRKEGGYVNNPADSGGETNWGITVADAKEMGYVGLMRDMPKETAKLWYFRKYWRSTGIEAIAAIDASIAMRLLDIAVNQGVYRSGEFCQRLLNALNRNERDYKDVKVDTKMGPATRAALLKFLQARGNDNRFANSVNVFEKGLRAMQGSFYIELAERRPKDEEFVYGWLLSRA